MSPETIQNIRELVELLTNREAVKDLVERDYLEQRKKHLLDAIKDPSMLTE